MKNLGLAVLIFSTSSFAIDQQKCTSLAANQKDNVIPDYQPLNQGNAGLCTSFAMSLSVSSALEKNGGKKVSPLSIAKSIEGWRTNGGNKQAVNDHVNFYGDSATKEDRLAVIDQTLNNKMNDKVMATSKTGVTANSSAAAATYGANSYANKDMEGVSIGELASSLAAEGKACSAKGSKFGGTSFEDWTSTNRKNYSTFTDFDQADREGGDASFLMGQLSYLYDKNKNLKAKGIQKDNLKKVVNQAKRVCDMQVTQVVKDKLKAEAEKINPCKGTIPFGPEYEYLLEVCNSGVFKPTMGVDEFVEKNKSMLINGEQAGFKEMLTAMQKEFFATQVSQKYSDEVNGNLDSGIAPPDAYIPKTLADKIAKEKEIIKTASATSPKFTKENAEYRLKNLEKSAGLMVERAKGFLEGQTTGDKVTEQIQAAYKEQTGQNLIVDKTAKRPISGNPRAYQNDFLSVAKSDSAFAANEADIAKLEDQLVKMEGQGNTAAYEEKMAHSLSVKTGNPTSQAIADQLKVKIEMRNTLTRKLNKQNMPAELLNGQGDLVVSFKTMDNFLARAAKGKDGSSYQSLRVTAHNADLSQQLSKNIKKIDDNWARTDRNISSEEFKANIMEIRKTLAAAKLDPSYSTMDKDQLSGLDLATLDKLATLDPKSPAAGSLIHKLREANRMSARPDPYDLVAQTDLDGDGAVETGSEDNLAKLEPFKSSPYAKALLKQKTLTHEYAQTKAEIINRRNDDKHTQQDINIERADLRYKNLNDCLTQNITNLVHDNIDPTSKRICEEGDNDLIYSLTSLASFFDDTDKVLNALDDSPSEFWNQVVECDPSEVVDLSGLNFDVYMLDKKPEVEKEDLMIKALEDSVAKGVPLTLGMCLNALQGKPCDANGGDNHAMAVVGYSANWNPTTKSCDLSYRVANSWGKKCDPRVDSSAAGVTCDSSNGIITVPQKVFNSGAKQMSVVKSK